MSQPAAVSFTYYSHQPDQGLARTSVASITLSTCSPFGPYTTVSALPPSTSVVQLCRRALSTYGLALTSSTSSSSVPVALDPVDDTSAAVDTELSALTTCTGCQTGMPTVRSRLPRADQITENRW